jgi:hypothetical protein
LADSLSSIIIVILFIGLCHKQDTKSVGTTVGDLREQNSENKRKKAVKKSMLKK